MIKRILIEGGGILSQWICGIGHIFEWHRKGEKTKPEKCPICGETIIDVREV